MKEIDLVNLALRAVGQAAINEIAEDSADSAIVRATLTRKRKELLSNSYQFNTNEITAQVQGDGKVRVSRDFLVHIFPERITYRVDPADTSQWILFDLDTNKDVTEDTEVMVIFDITTYENLPETFSAWLAHETAVTHFREVNKNEATPQWLQADLVRTHRRFMTSQDFTNLDQISGFTRLRNTSGFETNRFPRVK